MATMETVKRLLTLARVYPNQPHDDATRAVIASEWVRILADVPDEVLIVAYDEWSKSKEKFAPPPGWLYQRALEMTGNSIDERAEAGWEQVIDFREPIADPIALEAIRRAGGRDELGQTDTEDVHFFKDRYLKAYHQIAERERGQSVLASGEARRMIGAATLKLTGALKDEKRITANLAQ